jgi:hypothetical protein
LTQNRHAGHNDLHATILKTNEEVIPMLYLDNLSEVDEFIPNIIDAAEQLIVDYVMTTLNELLYQLDDTFTKPIANQIIINVTNSLILQLTELQKSAEKHK